MFYRNFEKEHLLIDILNYTQEFLATDPSLSEIKEEIVKYNTYEQEMINLKPVILLGPIELQTGMSFSYLSMYSKIMSKMVTESQKMHS